MVAMGMTTLLFPKVVTILSFEWCEFSMQIAGWNAMLGTFVKESFTYHIRSFYWPPYC